MFAIHLSQIQKKVFNLTLIIVLPASFLFLLLVINNNQNSTIRNVYLLETISDTKSIQNSQMISLASNSTIKNAIYELNEGFSAIKKNENVIALTISSLNSSLQESSFNYNNNIVSGYTNAYYKYHNFFNAYKEKLGYECICLVDIKQGTILYSTQTNCKYLFKKHPDYSFNKLVELISISSKKNKTFSQKSGSSDKIFLAVPVFSDNNLIGIVVATTKANNYHI